MDGREGKDEERKTDKWVLTINGSGNKGRRRETEKMKK